jgi:cytochrome P450
MFGQPCVALTGSDLVTRVQSMEFSHLQMMGDFGNDDTDTVSVSVFGAKNLMFEKDKEQHRFLRQLVGSAMTGTALQTVVPTLQRLADKYVDRVLLLLEEDGSCCMEEICKEYTSDIVQIQILGLDSHSQEERMEFQKQLTTWLGSMYSLWVNSGILVRFSPGYRARLYLTEKLGEQIDRLATKPPNSSTLSKMIHAVDEGDGVNKLTKEQVIENALLLVAAGTETSSSTLTLLMMLLSLHPDVFQKLAQEQEQLDPNDMTYGLLQSLPYLDAVVKEALRMGAVTGGFPRKTKETMIVNGYQIPKGWYVFGNYRLSHSLDPVTYTKDNSHMQNAKTAFQPERWLSPETTPSEFLPFGAGPRYVHMERHNTIWWCKNVNIAVGHASLIVFYLCQVLFGGKSCSLGSQNVSCYLGSEGRILGVDGGQSGVESFHYDPKTFGWSQGSSSSKTLVQQKNMFSLASATLHAHWEPDYQELDANKHSLNMASNRYS